MKLQVEVGNSTSLILTLTQRKNVLRMISADIVIFFVFFLKETLAACCLYLTEKKKSQKCTMNKGLFHKERQALFEYFFHLS